MILQIDSSSMVEGPVRSLANNPLLLHLFRRGELMLLLTFYHILLSNRGTSTVIVSRRQLLS